MQRAVQAQDISTNFTQEQQLFAAVIFRGIKDMEEGRLEHYLPKNIRRELRQMMWWVYASEHEPQSLHFFCSCLPKNIYPEVLRYIKKKKLLRHYLKVGIARSKMFVHWKNKEKVVHCETGKITRRILRVDR